MLARVSRRTALTALHTARAGSSRCAYSTQQHAAADTPSGKTEERPLDVVDAHLLNAVPDASPAFNPVAEVAQALHLPLGGESQLQNAGLKPAAVLEQPAPDADTNASSSSPTLEAIRAAQANWTPPIAPSPLASDVVSSGGPPSDAPIGMVVEESPAEYTQRRVKVEIIGATSHMAIVFAVVRKLEERFGRVAHFQMNRDNEVASEYSGHLIVTFKHLSSTNAMGQVEVVNDLHEPLKMIRERVGGVGLDELGELVARPQDEYGVVPREKAAAGLASNSNSTNADSVAALEADLVEDVSASGEEMSFSWRAGTLASKDQSLANDAARRKNLPLIKVRVTPMLPPRNFEGSRKPEYITPRLHAGNLDQIGRVFRRFRGFHPETPTSPRMQEVLEKWRPWMHGEDKFVFQVPKANVATEVAAPEPTEESTPTAVEETVVAGEVEAQEEIEIPQPTWTKREVKLTPQQEAWLARKSQADKDARAWQAQQSLDMATQRKLAAERASQAVRKESRHLEQREAARQASVEKAREARIAADARDKAVQAKAPRPTTPPKSKAPKPSKTPNRVAKGQQAASAPGSTPQQAPPPLRQQQQRQEAPQKSTSEASETVWQKTASRMRSFMGM